MNRVLYISYDGMTDPLGQSQVIPYLEGLASEGFEITLLSCEKEFPYNQHKEKIAAQLKKAGIKWKVVSYSKKPPVFSTVYDLLKLRRRAYALHKKENFRIIHCRSYISAFIGLWMKRKFDTRFIFDMRGFWADERVEGGIWDLKNPLYKKIYSFFKEKEKEFLTEADHVVSLTNKAKEIIHARHDIIGQPIPITVIPCCVDTDHFDPAKVRIEDIKKVRENLGLKDEDKLLTYLGSLGTWYMVEEMMLFYKELFKEYPEYKFLFITKDDPQIIYKKAESLEIPLGKIIATSSERSQLPTLLSVSNLAISFILPSFSKSASSPTKLGELFSMGIPVVCNKGVGDVDSLLDTNFSALLVDQTETSKFDWKGVNYLLKIEKSVYRNLSTNNFSLLLGVNRYARIYLSVENV